MSLGTTLTVALVGLEGHLVEVEADLVAGLPAFRMTGLPDASVMEARDRVRAAASNAGAPVPAHKITVNLSPAGLPKVGTGFDLAVAVALLVACEVLPGEFAAKAVHVGELGLDGRVRPVRGVLPCVLGAVEAGMTRVVVPRANEAEARLVPGAEVFAVGSLRELIAWYRGEEPPDEPEPFLPPDPSREAALPAGNDDAGDLADVLGQPEARHALEVAAAGGHHLLYVGPPGTGKTMLAARLPGLLPDLSEAHSVEVTALKSMAGTLEPGSGLVRRPPLERPHHSASMAALVGGGGGIPRPGAVSRAHRGVLFLDEATEFDNRALQSLRQPLEQGHVDILRSKAGVRYPARFQLVMASNPCPCGMFSGRGMRCTCTPHERRRYLGRLSGPLLDRVDLQVQLYGVSLADMAADQPESTAVVAARVAQALARQEERLRGTGCSRNVEVPGSLLRGRLRLPPAVTRVLDNALEVGGLSVRGYDRVLRTSWTFCDLAGGDRPGPDDIGQALALREGGVVG